MPSYFDPKLQIESGQRKRYADLLMQQAASPLETQIVGGYAVQRSPLEGLVKALQGGIAGYNESLANDLEMKAQENKQRAYSDALAKLATNPNESAQILMQNPETAQFGASIINDSMNNQQQAARDNLKFQRDLMVQQLRNQGQIDVAKARSGGGTYVDPETGEIVQQQPKLSPTSQKELYDTIDLVNKSQGALSDITRAEQLAKNGDIYSGAGADIATKLNRVPLIGGLIDDKKAANTTEYNNLMTGQALASLKDLFGGNPTEGERNILLQMQALADKTPQEQAQVLAQAKTALDRRVQFNQNKAKSIQKGDYAGLVDYNAPMNQQSPQANTLQLRAFAQQAIAQGKDPSAVAMQFKQMTGEDF